MRNALAALWPHPEFQSGLVRLAVCLSGGAYLGLAALTDYYRVDVPAYLTIFLLYLLSNLGFLASVARRPDWPARRSLGIVLDILVISLAIFLTQEAISPFYLLYILVFISAGTRFGQGALVLAAAAAILAYNAVLLALDEWRHHAFEAGFFLLLLGLLPLYQAALLRRVQQARAEAERANRAKGDFLAFMTHELRTPLTGVMGMAELLATTRLDARQREHVQAILDSADMLGALIGDILDFSKIEARRLTLEQVAFDPRALVQGVCDPLAVAARAKGIALRCDLDPALPARILGDPLRVRQILFNLVGNAVKFTERGEVRVALRTRPPEAGLACPHLLLEVQDTGIGIPAGQLSRLFERFSQVDESTTRRFGGTGLGTTIARELVLLMGGSIGVESEEGRGSRFWVRLPLPEAPPDAGGDGVRSAAPMAGVRDEAPLEPPDAGGDGVRSAAPMAGGSGDGQPGTGRGGDAPAPAARGAPDLVRAEEGPVSPEDPAPRRTGLRVLVAEDNEIAARVILSFLDRLGLEHDRFADGGSALAAALAGDYDLAILDLRMPELDGIGFARAWRARAGQRRLPMVALTANAAEDVRRACLDAGMDGFLAKPVRPDALRQTIDRLLPAGPLSP